MKGRRSASLSSFILSSVARHRRVYFHRPAVDAAREVVDLLEALAREEGADLRAAYAVVTEEDRLALGVERRCPLVEEAQGEEPRALDPRQFVLLRLAHVHEEQVAAAPHTLPKLFRRYRLEIHLASGRKITSRGWVTQTRAPHAGDCRHLRQAPARRKILRPFAGPRRHLSECRQFHP